MNQVAKDLVKEFAISAVRANGELPWHGATRTTISTTLLHKISTEGVAIVMATRYGEKLADQSLEHAENLYCSLIFPKLTR